MNTELSARYITAKYSNLSRAELLNLQYDASQELQNIKADKEAIFSRPGIHGRYQQSQLDVLDIRDRWGQN